MPSLSLVMILYNEREYLDISRKTFFDQFDQLVFVDMGSTDGSLDVIASCPPDRTTLISIERRTLFDHGFAHARNIGSEAASCDWIFAVDADEIVDSAEFALLRERIARTEKHVCGVGRRNYETQAGLGLHDWRAIAANAPFHEETHRRLHRSASDACWQGMIHEELWINDESAFFHHEHIPVTLHHLSAYRTNTPDSEKGIMYAWLTLRAFSVPSARIGTNSWWFDNYVPQHYVALCAMANDFADQYDLQKFDADAVRSMVEMELQSS